MISERIKRVAGPPKPDLRASRQLKPEGAPFFSAFPLLPAERAARNRNLSGQMRRRSTPPVEPLRSKRVWRWNADGHHSWAAVRTPKIVILDFILRWRSESDQRCPSACGRSAWSRSRMGWSTQPECAASTTESPNLMKWGTVAVLKRIDLVQRVLAVRVRSLQRELHILCEQNFHLMAKRLTLVSKDDRLSN